MRKQIVRVYVAVYSTPPFFYPSKQRQMNYTKKLSNPKWQKKRLEILQRDEFTCQLCNDRETELHIHHKKYSGEPWEVDNEHLITLCAHCHAVEETKEFNKIVSIAKRKQFDDSYCLYVVGNDKNDGVVLSIFYYKDFRLSHHIGFTRS